MRGSGQPTGKRVYFNALDRGSVSAIYSDLMAFATDVPAQQEVYHEHDDGAWAACSCRIRGDATDSAGDMMPRSIPQHRHGSAGVRRKRQPQLVAAATSEDKIDESLEESFPASDPPSWTLVTRIGSPQRRPRTLDDSDT